MLNVGDRLICKPKDQPETEHCVRGTVLKVENGNVTISRALKFGTLPMKRDLTLPEEELLKYYNLINELSDCDSQNEDSIYEVTITRTGVVFVKEASAVAAMGLADHLTTEEISWSDDWFATDATITNEHDGEVYTDPSY